MYSSVPDPEGKGAICITTAEHTKLHAFSLTLRDRTDTGDISPAPKVAKLSVEEKPQEDDIQGDANENQPAMRATGRLNRDKSRAQSDVRDPSVPSLNVYPLRQTERHCTAENRRFHREPTEPTFNPGEREQESW